MSPMTTLALGRSVTHDADGGGRSGRLGKGRENPNGHPKQHTQTHTRRDTRTQTHAEKQRDGEAERKRARVFTEDAPVILVSPCPSLPRCQHIRNKMDTLTSGGPPMEDVLPEDDPFLPFWSELHAVRSSRSSRVIWAGHKMTRSPSTPQRVYKVHKQTGRHWMPSLVAEPSGFTELERSCRRDTSR